MQLKKFFSQKKTEGKILCFFVLAYVYILQIMVIVCSISIARILFSFLNFAGIAW